MGGEERIPNDSKLEEFEIHHNDSKYNLPSKCNLKEKKRYLTLTLVWYVVFSDISIISLCPVRLCYTLICMYPSLGYAYPPN